MIGSAGLRWYRTGTVNVTQGSATVTGVGSQWQTAGIKPGDVFSLDSSMWYEVVSVESNTSLTLDMAFQGASGNAQNYKIIRNFAATMQAEIAARVANLVNKYESFIDAELQKLVGPKGDPGIMYKGAWAVGRSYQALDTVTHTDKVYLSRLPHTSTSNNAPGAEGSAWMEFALTAPPILDTLDSDRTDAALSAAQGKVLNDTKLQKKAGDVYLYVDASTGDDSTGDGTTNKPYRTITKAFEIARNISANHLKINIAAGVYNEPRLSCDCLYLDSLTIKTMSGEKDVEIKFNNQDSVGIMAWGSNFTLNLENIKMTGFSPAVGRALSLGSGVTAHIQNCDFVNFNYGFVAQFMYATVMNCSFENISACINAWQASMIFSKNNTSNGGCSYGLSAQGGIIIKAAQQPTGINANESKIAGGQIFG